MEISIAGAYATVAARTRGMGGTARETQERLLWFVMETDGEYEIFALNGQGHVTAVRKRLSPSEFAQALEPDPALFAGSLLPVMESLLKRLEVAKGVPDMSALSAGEKGMLLALRTALATQEGDRSAMLLDLLRRTVGRQTEILFRQCSESNARGMRLRREKDPLGALEQYRKAQQARPDDAHLLFNMARAHYEMGELDICRSLLGQSLRLEPQLREAKAFLRWLDARSAPHMAGG